MRLFCLNLVKRKLAKEVGGDEVHTASHEHGDGGVDVRTAGHEYGDRGWMKYKWLAVNTGMELTQMNKYKIIKQHRVKV